MWAVVTRCNPKNRWTSSKRPGLVPGPEPVAGVRLKLGPEMHLNSKVIINACKNYKWFKDYPVMNRVSE